MSDREHLKRVIDRLPEYKLEYIANFILDVEKMSIEEIEPDEWDLEMIEHAKKENSGQGVPIETLADELGINL